MTRPQQPILPEPLKSEPKLLKSKPLSAAAILEKGREKRSYLVSQAPIYEWEKEPLGIIPENSYTLLIAMAGHGKTWIALDLARLMATPPERRLPPLRWLGIYDVEPRKVLYLDEENGESLIGKRLGQLGLEESAEIKIGYRSGLKLENSGHLDELIAFCRHGGFKVVFFDSLVRFHRSEENDAQAMASVAESIRKLVEAKLTVIVLHHTRKGKVGDQVDHQRGSGELTAGADTVLLLENWQSQPTEPLGLGESPEWNMFTLSATKLRYADKNKFVVHRFRRQNTGDGIQFIFDETTAIYKKGYRKSSSETNDAGTRDTSDAGMPLNNAAKGILQRLELLTLKGGNITVSSVRGSKPGECPGCGKTKGIRGILNKLAEEKKVVVRESGSTLYYELPPPS